MASRKSALSISLVLLSLPVAGRSQTAALPTPDSRIRVWAPALQIQKQVFRFKAVRADTLLVEDPRDASWVAIHPDPQSTLLLLPTADVTRFQLSRGESWWTVGRGGLLGTLAGVLAGAAIGAASGGDDEWFGGLYPVVGAIIGAPVGLVLGIAVGSALREHWVDVSVPGPDAVAGDCMTGDRATCTALLRH